jgi:anti-sigma factor RsiW
MECAEALRVQAYFDGEVDALAAVDIERHLASCRECQRLLEDCAEVRSVMHASGAMVTAPAALRGRISQALDLAYGPGVAQRGRPPGPQRRAWSFRVGVLCGVGGSAVAAVLAYLIVAPAFDNPLLADLVADHTRSLMSSHLVDVVSTDQHTVKPWFAGRSDVSPVVADFGPQGYRLLGGRIDQVARQRAAVLVFQHGAHYINVFSWALAAGGVPRDTTRNGYHLACWKAGNLGYCAVSDTGWSELQGLVNLLQEQDARDQLPRQPAGSRE